MIITSLTQQSGLSTGTLLAELYPNAHPIRLHGTSVILSIGDVVDFSKYGSEILRFLTPTTTHGDNVVPKEKRLAKILGAQELIVLENAGTAAGFSCRDQFLDTETINQFFADLPVTNNGVMLDLRENPGAASCDPMIATAKGYTVIVD